MVKMSNGDGVVLTVRLIRSFEHRNIRHIVFKNVDLNQTTQEFMENINRGISCFVLLPPANEVWGKVMFLHLCVILFTRRVVHTPPPPG